MLAAILPPTTASNPSDSRPARRLHGFDVSYSLIPRDEILPGGPGKDGIPALTSPPAVEAPRAKYLKGSDLIVGVVQGNDSRAYPLRILVWHENVNDTLSGVPVAVSYCPLCHSALVFDRRAGGQVREFGVSGLLWNSNVLLYDRQPKGKAESLWSQVQMRAVAGPAAKQGLQLTLLKAELTSWRDWRRRHPKTTVLSDRTGYRRDYSENPYRQYFQNDRLIFPAPAKRGRPNGFLRKEMMVVVRAADALKAYAVRDVAKQPGDRGYVQDRVGHTQLRLYYQQQSDTVRVELVGEAGAPVGVAYMYWFAVAAMWPDVELYAPNR